MHHRKQAIVAGYHPFKRREIGARGTIFEMMRQTNVWDEKSPSDTYVIYDQFHRGHKDRLVIPIKGYQEALSTYRWYREVYRDLSLGFVTIELYNYREESYKHRHL